MAAYNELRADYQTVEAMAAVLQGSAVALRSVDVALEVGIALLHASAFTGTVGAELMAQYLEGIRPHVQRVAATCEALSVQLQDAMRYLQEADETIATRFSGMAMPAGGFVDGGVYAYNPRGIEEASPGDFSRADTVLITGIGTTAQSFKDAMTSLPPEWQTNLAGVYNEHGWSARGLDLGGMIQGFNDKRQAAFGVRLDGSNPAVSSTVQMILANANGDRELRLVGHSQGGAIIAAALQEIHRTHPEVDLSFVEVVTFGSFGTNFPPGPQYHHYVFSSDLVPWSGAVDHNVMSLSPLAPFMFDDIVSFARYTQNLTVLDLPLGTEGGPHALDNYLQHIDQFRAEEARVRRMGAWGTLGEMQELGLIPSMQDLMSPSNFVFKTSEKFVRTIGQF